MVTARSVLIKSFSFFARAAGSAGAARTEEAAMEGARGVGATEEGATEEVTEEAATDTLRELSGAFVRLLNDVLRAPFL